MYKRQIISLGVYPYITASIIMQIMNPVIPYLQNLAKEGEQGRLKINQITHYMMIPKAIAHGYGQLTLMKRLGGISEESFSSTVGLVTIAI